MSAATCPKCKRTHSADREHNCSLDRPFDNKLDGESWEDYAKRLERRIKEQRDLNKHLVELGKDGGNRVDRKRIARLEAALGQMTLRWEDQRAMNKGLSAKLRDPSLTSTTGECSALANQKDAAPGTTMTGVYRVPQTGGV